ncbi:tetratricopeptide repeat protein [Photobacterium carnosum]|uniref:tetratricopeptide repeat protein n=1 Tax=Photobacterium carnosum TaxID=2023717 RepID=UPI001E2ADDDB|nr:tetratricopeptide repeat protein [Photobacterium carnosum]MCD9539204.1 hypothetical protein [Photobacterium carnosum]MCF2163808.1 hypothetical protein [Photobacterium carnosum]
MRLSNSSLKKTAKKLKKDLGIKHSKALDLVAEKNGFKNWNEFLKAEPLIKRFSVFSDIDIYAMNLICSEHDCYELLEYLNAIYSWDDEYFSDALILELLDLAEYFDKNRDFIFAKYIYIRLNQLNNPRSLYRLGLMYDQGHGFKSSLENALNYYRKAASLGDYFAILEIAKMHLFGGLEKNVEFALGEIKPLVENKFSPAEVCLGYLYHVGIDGYISINKDKAEKLWKSAASQDNRDALYNLYCLYNKSDKQEMAISFLCAAAKKGLEMAQAELVVYYINKNDIKAAEDIVYDSDNYFHGIPQSILGEYYLSKFRYIEARKLLVCARDVNNNEVARKILKRYLPTESTKKNVFIV